MSRPVDAVALGYRHEDPVWLAYSLPDGPWHVCRPRSQKGWTACGQRVTPRCSVQRDDDLPLEAFDPMDVVTAAGRWCPDCLREFMRGMPHGTAPIAWCQLGYLSGLRFLAD